MSGNEINKGKIYVAYITTLGIPELTYALAYVVDEASASGVKRVAEHTSSSIGWAKQDIRRVYNLEKYKELFPQGYEMIDLDEIKIHCRVGIDLCADLAIDEVRKAAGLKDQTPHREEKKESSEQTHAEIIAECYHNTAATQYVRKLLDRLDAAHKREIDELKKQFADLQQQLPKPDPNWRDICAKCFENGATEPPDCKYYTEDGCMSPIPDQHPLIQVGNAAKLREAAEVTLTTIKKCMDILNSIPSDCGYDGLVEDVGDELCGLRDDFINAALAAPPRNCERFQTKDAARDAFQKLRHHRVWADVSLWDDRDEIEAFLDWLFALGKEGGAK